MNGRRTIPWFASAIPLFSFLILGLPAGALGVAWPFMQTSFGAPLAGLGLLLGTWTVAYFVASAASGPLTERLGTRALLAGGCAVAAIGLFGLSVAAQWWMVPIIISLVGAGSGLIDAVTNAQTSLHRSLGYMGWLHASWAAGAAIGPQLIALSVASSSSWRFGFATMGFAFAAVAILVGWDGVRGPGRSVNRLATPAVERASPTIGRPLLLLAGLFLLGAGLEATAGDWAYSQLTLGRGLSTQAASLAASLFWAGLGTGRIALGLAGNRASPTLVLDGSIALTLIAALSFWLAPPLASALIALPLIGVAVSVFFPVLLSITPARVGRDRTSRAVGYGLAAGTVGAGGLPALAGVILQGLGLLTLGPLLLLMAVALAALHAVSRNGGARQRSARPAPDRPVS